MYKDVHVFLESLFYMEHGRDYSRPHRKGNTVMDLGRKMFTTGEHDDSDDKVEHTAT